MTPVSADAVAALPGPPWLQRSRQRAFERFASAALPTTHEEIWRYSRIEELDLDRYTPLAADVTSDATLPAALQAVIDTAGPWSGLAIVRNGRLAHAEVDPGLAARGVVVGDLASAAASEELLGRAAAEVDVFTDLNHALMSGGVLIDVPDGVVVPDPVAVVHWLDAAGSASFPRTIVNAAPSSEVSVVEYAGSTDVDAFTAPVAELLVGDNANVSYLAVQDLGSRVWQVGYSGSRVGRDATLRSATVALGGDYARVRTDSRLVGEGGTSYLMAAYFGDGTQMHDFRTLQEHVAPKTTSDLVFKGAVGDASRSVYTGLILVRRGAKGTNAFQTNRNLVLDEGANAESVPNLESEENDIRCGHGSTIGPIDEDQRYYLQSRGVPPEAADRLIVMGFFDEVLERMPAASLRPRIRERVAAKVEGSL